MRRSAERRSERNIPKAQAAFNTSAPFVFADTMLFVSPFWEVGGLTIFRADLYSA